MDATLCLHLLADLASASARSSHYLFRLKLCGKNETTGASSEGELNLVDLAGSERVKESGVQGKAMTEAQARAHGGGGGETEGAGPSAFSARRYCHASPPPSARPPPAPNPYA